MDVLLVVVAVPVSILDIPIGDKHVDYVGEDQGSIDPCIDTISAYY